VSWFRETLHPHYGQTLSMDRVLHRGRTNYQDVLVFENALFGTVLVLDGAVQVTERDNHIYHEMIAHVPALAHCGARRALVVGGGDGGAARELLRHPLEHVVMVELDAEVVELSRRFLPGVADGAFDDPRLELVIADGTEYVAAPGPAFDVIVIDSTDPIGPGEVLFTEDFYRACRRRLAPGGIIVAQSGAPFFQPGELDRVIARLAAVFPAAVPYMAPVPTYAGGMLALVAAGDSAEALCPPLGVLDQRFAPLSGATRYYTPEVHRAAFAMAPSFRNATAAERAEAQPVPLASVG